MHSRLFLNNNNNPKVVASLYAAAVCTRQPFAESRVLSLFTARVMCYYPLHHHHHHHHRCQVVVLLPVDNPCHPPLLPGWRKMSGRAFSFSRKKKSETMTKSFGVPTQQQQTHNNPKPVTCRHLPHPQTVHRLSKSGEKEISSWTFLFFHLNKNHLIIIFHPKSQ
jgi:hypothetical protein